MERNGKLVRVPMEDAARALNQRAGLYLSDTQQRGLAAGLFVGAVVGVAALTWTIGLAVRRSIE